MKFFMLLWWVVAAVRADNDTHHLYIDGVIHQQLILVNDSVPDTVYSLAVDYKYNYLYYIDNKKPCIFDLSTNERKSYAGTADNARSLSVDQENNDLYIATFTGVFKYNPSTGEERLIGTEKTTVWHVFFNKVLYYLNNFYSYTYTLIHGRSKKLRNIKYGVHKIVIDNDDVAFFSKSYGFFSQEMDSNQTTLYYNEAVVHDVAMDRNGKVYFVSDFGIFEVIKHNATYRQVVDVTHVRALAFDENNHFIYFDIDNIYRLKPIPEGN